MADIDSAGASNRQAPATVRRNTARPRVRRKLKPERASQVPIYRSRRSRSSNDDGGNRGYRRRRVVSREGGRRRSTSVRRSTPPTARTVQPPKPAKPMVPDVNAFLKGDTTYQRQLAAYAKALSDFNADQTLSRGDYNTNYQNMYRDIGLAKGEATEDLRNDFASRGMLQSSLYTQGLGDLNSQYANQYGDLSEQRTAFIQGLANDLNKFRNEQGTQSQNARAEALRRRTEKYGI